MTRSCEVAPSFGIVVESQRSTWWRGGILESLRHHADHGAWPAIQEEVLAENLGIAANCWRQQPVTENHDAIADLAVLLVEQGSAQQGGTRSVAKKPGSQIAPMSVPARYLWKQIKRILPVSADAENT